MPGMRLYKHLHMPGMVRYAKSVEYALPQIPGISDMMGMAVRNMGNIIVSLLQLDNNS